MRKDLDLFEYANDASAQAAYVSNDTTPVTSLLASLPIEYWVGDSVSLSAVNTQVGEAISLPACTVTSVKFYLAKSGTPTGNLGAAFYACSGTPGSTGQPTGGALATSSTYDVSTFSTDFTLIEFTFSTPYVAAAGNYCVSLEYSGTSFVTVAEKRDPDIYAGGNRFINGIYSSRDLFFYLYTSMPTLQSYSEATIKTQDSYSLKGIAVQTNSLNKTFTKTVSPTIDLTGITQVKFDIRSSRTGSNIKIGIKDSGGTITEITPNILSANTWQEVTINLQNVSNVNKDVIESIIITIINADADNIFYLDNLFGFHLPQPIIMG